MPAGPTTSGSDPRSDATTATAGRHRFQRRQSESLVERRKDENSGAGVESLTFGIRDVPDVLHVIGKRWAVHPREPLGGDLGRPSRNDERGCVMVPGDEALVGGQQGS